MKKNQFHQSTIHILYISILVFFIASQNCLAGPIRSWISKHRSEKDNTGEKFESINAPGLISDISYGEDAKNKMDVYLPKTAENAPVIFMVHGGAWQIGDKTSKAVVKNKIDRWVSKGFVFISTNYRLLPEAKPLEQAQDVAKALAFAQKKAPSWGADPSRFILMGHSAGAHLVAILGASSSIAKKMGARPFLGTVAIDCAALNVVTIMRNDHPGFYDKAFGKDIAYWEAASPFYLLTRVQPPFLAICSTQRDDSCFQAARFVQKAALIEMRAQILDIDLSHKETNEQLGKNISYTLRVEAFLASLDPSVKKLLEKQ